MAFKDNREFVEALEKTRDVIRIKEQVDWDLEVGAICRRACERYAPAPFFEKVKDYPDGYRILGIPLATYRRLAIAMGLPADSSVRLIQEEYECRIDDVVQPVVVKDAPCKKNVVVGDEVSLFRFPAPMIQDGNGARDMGTWHMVITKDPDSDWVNWGMYRAMIYDGRHLAGGWHRHNHGGRLFYGKYQPRKLAMPVAIAIGADPLSSLVAAAPIRAGQSEAGYAGGLRSEPVELVKCETNDLLVPAHAEIVLEGEILPDSQVPFGPYGEFPGYRSPERPTSPAFRVKAITHRNDPILTMSCLGIVADDGAISSSLTGAVALKKRLRDWGIPVTDVYVPPAGAGLMVIVGVKNQYCNIATQVKNIIHSRWAWYNKIIVVEDDVDVFNVDEVLHAFATKCHPARGIRVTQHEVALGLTPFLSPEERKWQKGAGVVFDCTWPRDWPLETHVPLRTSFNEAYHTELKDKVMENWQKYGFK